MKNPTQPKIDILLRKKPDKYDLIKDINEISSKSLLANVIDEKTREFVLNDDFGIIRSILLRIKKKVSVKLLNLGLSSTA
jgi:hypothetical protein